MTLDPTCVISDSAILFGLHPIAIGANTVIHPRSQINSTFAPINIGPDCIISERAHVGLQQEPESPSSDSYSVTLQGRTTLEPAAHAEAAVVGEGSLLEAGCRVERGAELGKASNWVVAWTLC